MGDWEEVRLEDVTSKLGDGLHGTPKYEETGEYYFINGNNLSDGKIVVNEKTKRSTKEEYSKYKKKLNDRTILVSINGTLGNIALYDNEKVFLGKSACYFNVNENVNKQYIRYVLTSLTFQNYIHSLATGSTIKNVSLKLMRDFRFKLPSLNTQNAISKILLDLDNKIATNRNINQTLEEMAQGVFKSWFVDFEPVRAKMAVLESGGSAEDATIAAMQSISGKSPDELISLKSTDAASYHQLKTTANLFPSRLTDSNLGDIPEGWEVKSIGDIFTPKKGKTITKKTITEGNIPVVAGGLEPAYYHNQANVESPVITVSASGANAGFVRLYHQDIWASDCSYINKIHTPFIYSIYTLLKSRQEKIFGMQQGAAQPHIYPSDLMRLIINDASLEIWAAFEKIAESLYEKIKGNIEESQTLTQLRDTLLPKLLSGEINVSAINSSEAA